MYTMYNIKIYKFYDIYIYMTSLLLFHYIFNVYKNYETQIIKYKRFANLHETQNVQCKICIKRKIYKMQTIKYVKRKM